MHIIQLDLLNLRVFEQLQVTFTPQINVLTGKNGRGKTSVLEAIHLLAYGRSFRATHHEAYIRHRASHCTIHAQICSKNDQNVSIGVERYQTGEKNVFIKGLDRGAQREISRQLPMILVNQQSFDLLEGGPEARRRFMDWGMFHVEHFYEDLWRKYTRCLKQRNQLLKQGASKAALSAWTLELASCGELLSEARQRFVAAFLPFFQETLTNLLPTPLHVGIRYLPGWEGGSLGEALDAAYIADRHLGYTTVGPQRADLDFHLLGQKAQQVLSRGQQKMFVLSLYLALGAFFAARRDEHPIYLLDDVFVELDAQNRGILSQVINQVSAQFIVTVHEDETVHQSGIRVGQVVAI
ncbi:MAG: DNA replication/repair protein RecF [Pseudomonadota bacterium]